MMTTKNIKKKKKKAAKPQNFWNIFWINTDLSRAERTHAYKSWVQGSLHQLWVMEKPVNSVNRTFFHCQLRTLG